MRRIISTLCILAVCAGVSSAKVVSKQQTQPSVESGAENSRNSNSERDALGFSAQLNGGVNFITFRHWDSGKIGFEGLFGIEKDNNHTTTDIGAKVLGRLKQEQHLTAYWFGLLAVEPYSGSGSSGTNTYLAGGLGAEFFFQGLPNLSVCAEAGLGYSSPNSRFGNTDGWLPSLGVRYYYK